MKGSCNGRSRFRFGQFEADLSEEKLFKRGLPIRLENQPFRVLAALLEQPGNVVDREELCGRLWPNGTFVDFDEGLNTAIKKLRYALGDSADNPVFIETIPRRGYRFLAPISAAEDEKGVPGKGNPPTSLTGPENPSGSILFSEPGACGGLSHQNRTTFSSNRGRTLSLIVLLSMLAAGSWAVHRWQIHRFPSGNFGDMEIRKLTDTGDANAVAVSPDGRYMVYARRMGEKSSLRMRQLGSGGDVEVLPPDAVDFVGLTFSPDGNYLYFARSDKDDPGYKYLYVMPALGGPARKLITDIDSAPSFAPDGRQFVFTRGFPTKNEVQIRIANPDGTGDHLVATVKDSFAGYQPGATWSPDGRTITVPVFHFGKRLRSTLYAMAVADGSQRELYSADGYVGRPLWLPGGDAILVTINEPDPRRGQLWMIAFPSGRRKRVTNDLSDYDLTPDMTSDGRYVIDVVRTQLSNIWISSSPARLEQITFGESAMLEAIESDNGKLVVLGLGELWRMNPDGRSRESLAKLDADHISRCGTFVVASVRQEGLQHIVRLDNDGTHAVSLASGALFYPTCSSEGKFVFYVDLGSPQRILRIPIEGGAPVEIARIPGDGIVGPLDISSDGKSLAFPWEQFSPAPGVHLSVVSSTEGRFRKSFEAPPEVYGIRCLRWSQDDSGLEYTVTRDGVTNLWQQRMAGGPPKQVTKFTSGLIFSFNRSKHDKQLLLARGSTTSDVVLLSRLP